MLLGTLGDSLLGNLLTGKGIVRVGYGNKKEKGKYKNIVKMNQDLMVFLQEIIYLKK